MDSKRKSFLEEIFTFVGGLILTFLLIIFVLVSFFFAGVLFITPQANLPRNNDGIFIVNSDNYSHWHTYSRIFNSSSNKVVFDGQYILRSMAKPESSCEQIKNCESYESEFYRESRDKYVWLIKKEDDKTFSDYRAALTSAITNHNRSIVDFSTKVSFNKPDFPKIFALEMSIEDVSQESSPSLKLHNQKVNRAKTQCLNNGRGCGVTPHGTFSYFGFPSIDIQVK